MPALPLNTYPVVPQKRILNRVFCFFFVAVARVSRGFSTFFRCPHNCIFEYSTGHNGPSRTRNTNLAPLAPETMLSQPILIELLVVLLLLPTHILFSSPTSRYFSLTTCLKSSCIHFDFTPWNTHEIWRKVLRSGCPLKALVFKRVLTSKSGFEKVPNWTFT